MVQLILWVGLQNNQSNGDAREFFPERVGPSERIESGLLVTAGERGAVFRIGCDGRSLSRLTYRAVHRQREYVALILTR